METLANRIELGSQLFGIDSTPCDTDENRAYMKVLGPPVMVEFGSEKEHAFLDWWKEYYSSDVHALKLELSDAFFAGRADAAKIAMSFCVSNCMDVVAVKAKIAKHFGVGL